MHKPDEEEESSDSEALLAALILHQVFLARTSGGIRNTAIESLNDSEARVSDLIRRRLANSQGLRTPRDVRRFQALMATIKTARSGSFSKIRRDLIEEMTELALYQPDFLGRLIARVSGADVVLPSPEFLRTIARSQAFEGRTVGQWVDHLESEDLRRISAEVQRGMVAGESEQAIARRVLGTRSARGRNGATQTARRNLETVIRTAVTQVSAAADRELVRLNPSIFDRERYTAVLDGRTTAICRSLSGNIYPAAVGPIPPLHWNCRSSRIPIFVGDSPPDVPNYTQWLRGQTNGVQDDILGPARSKLFRKGGLTLDRFVNRKGDQIPLKDLARREAEGFRRAGIEI